MLRPEIEPLLRDAGVGSPLGLFICLLLEREGPQRLTDLAQRMHLPLSTVSGLCDRLVVEGFLCRSAHPHDRRSIVLAPTERACTVAEGVRHETAARLGTMLAAMDPATLEGLISGLTVLVEALEGAAATPARQEGGSRSGA
jgi:DNA-binding MarR family transcriptional regulator